MVGRRRTAEMIRIGGGGLRAVWQESPKTPAGLHPWPATVRGSRWQFGSRSDRPRRLAEPGARGVVDLRRHHLADARVVGVEPGLLRLGQQAEVDRVGVDRRKRQRLELEVTA